MKGDWKALPGCRELAFMESSALPTTRAITSQTLGVIRHRRKGTLYIDCTYV